MPWARMRFCVGRFQLLDFHARHSEGAVKSRYTVVRSSLGWAHHAVGAVAEANKSQNARFAPCESLNGLRPTRPVRPESQAG